MFLQLLVNGIVMGSIYSLVALGYALVYNTTRIFHIAYAAIYMFAPYMIYSFYFKLHFPFILAFTVSLILSMILSYMIEIIVYRPLFKKGSSLNVVMISSIGIMIVIINLIALFYGNETKILNTQISKSISIGKIIITYSQLYQLIGSIIVMVLFMIALKFTKFGLKTRAMRDDIVLSKVFALDIFSLRNKIFLLSGLFAAIASGLIAYDVGMDPYVGMPMLLNAVVALIIGGVGRFEAPILGGFIIGVLQSMTVWVFSSRWQNAITFVLLIIFLLVRPQGILGEKRRAV